MPSLQDTLRLRKNTHTDGSSLTKEQRESIVKPYLPPQQNGKSRAAASNSSASDPILHAFSQTRRAPPKRQTSGWQRPRIRPLIAAFLHYALFSLIQLVFSVYIHTRRVYHAVLFQCLHILYYHHRSPELIRKDVKDLSRVPNHISVILDIVADDSELGDDVNWEGLEKLIRDVCELSAWCVCTGIPLLSVYERTGTLKQHMPYLQKAIQMHLRTYFPTSAEPTFDIRAPHQPATKRHKTEEDVPHLELLLLSPADGRDTLVDLTKTLAEMSQRGKLSLSDISPELIDGQVAEASFSEPDLLVVMAPSAYRSTRSLKKHTHRKRSVDAGLLQTSTKSRALGAAAGEICLRGYPPWQVRLTEIFQVQDSNGVEYQTFLRALCRYAKAEMRFGR